MNEDLYFGQNNPQMFLPPKPKKEKRSFTKSDSITVYACILMGYLFIKLVLFGGLGVVATIYFLLFYMISYFYLKTNKIALKPASLFQLLLINVFNINFLLFSNYFIKFLNLIFVIVAIIYWCYTTCDITRTSIIQKHFPLEMIKAIIILPFSCYGTCFDVISDSVKKNKSGKRLAKIFLGLCLALPITFIVAGLLLSADVLFSHIISSIFSDISDEILIFIIQLLFGIPIACYLFGMLYANANHMNQNTLNKESCEKVNNAVKIIPASVLYTAVTPVCLLYALFFFAQSAYLLSGFQNYLPQNFSYAEYARRGFFELCVIAVINLSIIVFMNCLCKHKKEKPPVGLKIYTIVISVFTLLLIATALSKMVMYIDAFGLTLLRVYTSWFMVLLGVIFILSIFKMLLKNMKFFKSCVACFIILFAVLSFGNVDALIAKYNVAWYQNGRLSEIDIYAMYELSDSAVQYVLPLTKSSDKQVDNEAKDYINQFKNSYKTRSWKEFNLSSYRAYQAVIDYQTIN